MSRIIPYSPRLGWLLALAALGLIGLGLLGRPAQASAPGEPAALPPVAPEGQVSNATCLACHAEAGRTMTLPNGDALSITVDPAVYGGSAHAALSCIICHTDITAYPHPAVAAQTARDYTLEYQGSCKTCHPNQFAEVQDSMHTKLLLAGDKNAPTCADCHNPHVQGQVKDDQGNLLASERAKIPGTCASCHSGIFNEYAASVHGSAVLAENNPDVPTCTYCHGVHKISDPTSAQFRLSSINLCASCHTDETVMAKYDLSTAVLNTYVADFHGTTTTLYQHQSPDEMTNKPVCYDCHGIHAIYSVDDPQKGLHVKANIQKTCERCHPNIGSNFPDSWLSHYIPSPKHAPLVYYVSLIYQILIPTVIGGMLVFVASDAYRRFFRRQKPGAGKEETAAKAPLEAATQTPIEAPAEAAAEAPAEAAAEAPADDEAKEE